MAENAPTGLEVIKKRIRTAEVEPAYGKNIENANLTDLASMDAAAIATDRAFTGAFAPQVDIQVFSNPGTWTWTPPANARVLQVTAISGTSGAGSGRRGAPGTVRCGGGGSAGAGVTASFVRASDLTQQVQIVVGAGGVGGAAVMTDNTDGNPGTAGTYSAFGSWVRTNAAGAPGSGGTATSGAGAAATVNAGGSGQSLAAGSASAVGGVGSNGNSQGAAAGGVGRLSGPGGGAGGGISSVDVASAGGNGGPNTYVNNVGGYAGVVGGASPTVNHDALSADIGGGGGGGAASTTSAAQAGARGGRYGGGAGGGGASANGFPSGAGGDGSPGCVIVVTQLDPPAELSDIVCWGDSLTAGAGGSGTTYPGVLASLSGRTVFGRGVGGETSTQIATRAGGVTQTVTLPGNSLPGIGAALGVTSNGVPSIQAGATTYRATLKGVPVYLTYSGGSCSVARVESSITPLSISVAEPVRMEETSSHAFRRMVIWAGRNDTPNFGALPGNIAAIIAANSVKKFVVVGVTVSAPEVIGSGNRNAIIAANAALAATYGSRFLDILPYLSSAQALADASITATGQDLTDISNGVIPTSLRSDNTHLNAAGYTLVANQVWAKIQALGI